MQVVQTGVTGSRILQSFKADSKLVQRTLGSGMSEVESIVSESGKRSFTMSRKFQMRIPCAKARLALTRIGVFLEHLRSTAEQLTPVERWYRILSEALVKYLKGRKLDPPRQLQVAT